MSWPRPSWMRVPGTRTAEPSIRDCEPVKMIHPAVGWPTTLPKPSARYPSVKSSASDKDDSLVTSAVGSPSARWPSAARLGTGNRSRVVIVR